MNETGFRIFKEIYPVAAELMYSALLAAFFSPFVMPKERRLQKLAIVFSICFIVWLFCDQTAPPRGFFGAVVTVLLMVASKWLGLQKSLAFLLALFYFNAKISSGLMVDSLYFIIEKLLPVKTEPLETVFLCIVIQIMAYLLSHAALLAVMLYVLQRQMRKQKLPLHRRELCYIGLVPMAGILFGQMLSRLWFELKDGVVFQLYERHPAFLVLVPVLALLFYAGAYLSVMFQQEMAVLRKEQATLFAERQQTQAIRMRIHEAEQFYAHIRELKHEMRGHLTNIKGLARSGEYVGLKDYIDQMDESINDFTMALQTGNPVSDVIVNDKRKQCLDLGISFLVDFHYPESGAYDAFDVGIILQNLLQNALEACEKAACGERFITLTGKQRGRFFLIEIKNSFEGEIIFGEDGLPVTSKKEDAPMHGIGLSNVRRETEKYMGELELKTGLREFCATVLLQERSSL